MVEQINYAPAQAGNEAEGEHWKAQGIGIARATDRKNDLRGPLEG